MNSDTAGTRTRDVALVGHCTPDSSFLTITAQKAVKGVRVLRCNNDADVERAIADDALLLVNRKMEYGYADDDGNAYIRRLRAKHPNVKTMLISNFPESQAQAVADGALMGFGKNHLGEASTLEKIRQGVQR